jgi:plasmid stabilization system protein ParE
MKLTQTSLFARFVKKQLPSFKRTLDKEITKIIENPEIGQGKKGELSEIKVHKFKHNKNLFLVAYSIREHEIWLIMIGAHENFYRDLKNYLK